MATTIRGLNEVVAALNALPEAVRLNLLGDAVTAAAEVIRAGASARAPVLTGQLAGDIVIFRLLEPDGFRAKIGPSKRSFYGRFQETGTKHQPPYPFLKPALEQEGPRAQEVMRAYLERGIETETARLRANPSGAA